MSRRGLEIGVYEGQRPPDTRLVSDRPCDFAGLLAAIQELLGSRVQLSVMGQPVATLRAPLILSGELGAAFELGRANDAPVVVEVPGGLLSLSERTVTAARREQYECVASGRRWLLVWIEFSPGVSIEIEQVSADNE